MTGHKTGFHASRALALAAAAGLMVMAAGLPANAGDADVVATVDGKAIIGADVKMLEALMGDALARVPEGSRHAVLVNVLVETRLLAAAAEAAGKGRTADFARRLDWLKAQALRDDYVREDIDAQVTDAVVKSRYDEMIKQVKPEREIRARHILVASEEEAKAIIAELGRGGDFAALAKAKSSDRGGVGGGDLGFFGRGRMVPEFDKAAFELKVGEHSKTPVKTQYGWHVIKVEEERAAQPPAFEEVRVRLRERLQAQKLRDVLAALRAKARIETKQPVK